MDKKNIINIFAKLTEVYYFPNSFDNLDGFDINPENEVKNCLIEYLKKYYSFTEQEIYDLLDDYYKKIKFQRNDSLIIAAIKEFYLESDRDPNSSVIECPLIKITSVPIISLYNHGFISYDQYNNEFINIINIYGKLLDNWLNSNTTLSFDDYLKDNMKYLVSTKYLEEYIESYQKMKL